MVGRTGEVEKWWKKKKKIGQGGWDFRPSRKRPQRAHPQLVHWWVLIHSSRKVGAGGVVSISITSWNFAELL